MSEQIPLSVPSIQGNEWNYIKECLDTEWVSSAGKYVDLFEENICRLTGARHAVAVVNGTAALFIALKIIDVNPGDEVIVPSLTFIAPVNVVKYMNAEPIFMDCDEFYNMDITKTITFIREETIFREGYTFNKKTNKKIKAIIPVHVFGNAVDLEPLVLICRERNIKIVEDATESLGAYYTSGNLKGKFTGTVGDVGCYSFNGNKIITTGGGGMLVTNDPELARQARYLTTQAKDDEVCYIHNDVGYNCRLTNIQAAMGVAQLERLSNYIEIKKRNYLAYRQAINNVIPGLCIADTPGYAESNYWFYSLQINEREYGKTPEALMQVMAEYGIQTRPVWFLNHLQKPYLKCSSYKIDKAIELHKNSLNIPCSVNLKQKQIDTIISLLRKVHNQS